MKRVLILCTGNSCRSQMAEALWQQLSRQLQLQWEAHSAGARPSGYVHPLAIEAMRELSQDISQFRSKSVEEFTGQPFDLVITVCDHAQQACPHFATAKQVLHWPFDDPADATGSDAEKMVTFRRVRDEIRDRIKQFLHLVAADPQEDSVSQ